MRKKRLLERGCFRAMNVTGKLIVFLLGLVPGPGVVIFNAGALDTILFLEYQSSKY